MLTSTTSIATLGSHTALQILYGARQEGFKTVCIITPERRAVYQSFGVADTIEVVKSFKDAKHIERICKKHNAVLVPHGSFVEYLGVEKVKKMKLHQFGNTGVLAFEADREKQRLWLKDAGIHVPHRFKNYKDIDRTVIVKFHGARGGKGYFLARTPEEFSKKITQYSKEDRDGCTIQEYVVGVPVYTHYFYSPLSGELEIMGFDKRYESNADSIGRIAAGDQMAADIATSYTIVGNIPIVVRESLLPTIFKMGSRVVAQSKRIAPPGLIGSFCLEGIVTSELEYVVFEISARIVAGTNPFIHGSPYSQLKYTEPMSTGRRIAREIKIALESDRLNDVCCS